MTDKNANKISAVGDGFIPIKTSPDFIKNGSELLQMHLRRLIDQRTKNKRPITNTA